MPAVTECSNPNGEPIATTHWPALVRPALALSKEPGGGVTPFSRHQEPGSRWLRRALHHPLRDRARADARQEAVAALRAGHLGGAAIDSDWVPVDMAAPAALPTAVPAADGMAVLAPPAPT